MISRTPWVKPLRSRSARCVSYRIIKFLIFMRESIKICSFIYLLLPFWRQASVIRKIPSEKKIYISWLILDSWILGKLSGVKNTRIGRKWDLFLVIGFLTLFRTFYVLYTRYKFHLVSDRDKIKSLFYLPGALSVPTWGRTKPAMFPHLPAGVSTSEAGEQHSDSLWLRDGRPRSFLRRPQGG